MRLLQLSLLFVTLSVAGVLVWYILPHLPEHVSRRAVVYNDREVSLLVINLTQGGYAFSLVENQVASRNVRTWREETGAEIVFNAAYFVDNLSPAGYFKIDSKQSAVAWPSVEQQLDPASYTFLVMVDDGELDLRYLPATTQAEPTSEAAFLSFPTLVVQGEPMVHEDSELHAGRTILATSAVGDDYLILTERGDLSLYEAAQWIAAQPEDFVIAGNLDGGPSTGLSLEHGKFDLEVISSRVPNVIVGSGRVSSGF